MTSLVQREVLTVPPSEPTLDAFFEHVRYTNPFAANRVVPSTIVKEDASQIHRSQFNRLTELATLALNEQIGIGALVWGDAGVGKSHLLGRLGNWAGADKHAIFVYLANLQAQPDQMPRSLLRYVISILTRGRMADFPETPLFRIVRAAVKHALQDDGGQHLWSMADAAYGRLVDDLCAATPARAALVDRPTHAVLFRFFRSVYMAHEGDDDGIAALAVRWLSGDPLDSDEAKKLGLPARRADETAALADDDQIKRVLIALTRFAAFWGRPVILCFDQVDNLEREQFTSLSRFLQALLDGATNLLVVTAGVRQTLFRWESEGVFTQAALDRLGQHRIELQRVNFPEARQIIQARLQPFQEPFLSVPQIRALVQKDYLFPLGEPRAKAHFGDKIDIRPRDVINWAAEEWRGQQNAIQEAGGPAWLERWTSAARPQTPPLPPPSPEVILQLIDDKVTLKLREHVRQRQLESQTLPPDGDNLAGLLHALLQHCRNTSEFPSLLAVERQVPPKYGTRLPFDLILRLRPSGGGTEVRAGLLCLVVSDKTSMAAYLRRLQQDTVPPEYVFLVTDERRPLDPAAAGREYLQQIRQRHGDRFRHVSLTFDLYAELDALQAVVGLSRSGDLEIELPGGEVQRVSESEVIASHLRQGRFVAQPLLHQILTNTAAPPAPTLSKDANGQSGEDRSLRDFIKGQLGITMGCSSVELAVQYQDFLRQKKQEPPELEECRARLEEEARRLHQDDQLIATPHDDYLYLLNK